MSLYQSTLRHLRTYFMAGLLVVTPVFGTIWLLKIMIIWADEFMVSLLPSFLRPPFIFDYRIPGMGLVATLIVILLIGALTRLYLGKIFIAWGDRVIARIPLGRSIYAALKQLFSTIFSPHDSQKRAVIIEYPKEGCYAIGFLTGMGGGEIAQFGDRPMARVFIPTTPNPTSGFLLLVPAEKVYATTLTTDEASKLIISGGLFSGKVK